MKESVRQVSYDVRYTRRIVARLRVIACKPGRRQLTTRTPLGARYLSSTHHTCVIVRALARRASTLRHFPHLPLVLHLFSAVQIRRRTYDVPSAYYINIDYT